MFVTAGYRIRRNKLHPCIDQILFTALPNIVSDMEIQPMKSFLRIIICLFTLPVCVPVSAELMGLVPGRSAYVPAQATMSVELGASWYTNQLQWTATRINFKPSPRVVTYLDISLLQAIELRTENGRLADFIGAGYGGGIMFAVPDFLTKFDVAFNASFHSSVIDEVDFKAAEAGAGAVRQALQQSQWSAAFLFSPLDPLFESGTSWYSSLGFVSTEARTKARTNGEQSASGATAAVDYKQINGVAAGAGLFKPFSKGRLYAGFEWLAGDPLIGVGASYSFR